MKIKKALITTAGFGTRFLPISKTIQKEMLPILDRPLVDYVVADLVKAGVEEIVFVISEHNRQILHYYQENPRLYNYLKRMGKEEKYQEVEHIHQQAKFTFVRQPDSESYGTAVPVKIAQSHFENEDAFFVFMGDDFIYQRNGDSEAKAMIELFNQTQSGGVATFIEKPEDQLSRYGIAEVEQKGGFTFLKKIVEKPAPGTAPSNLSNISKYILTPQIFDIIHHQKLDPKSGELYITDSVQTLAQQAGVAIHTPRGQYLDGGDVHSWLKANLTVAWENQELRAELIEFLKTLPQ